MLKPMVVCLGIVWGAASPRSCESTDQLASACDGGVCPDAPAQPAEGPQCVFSEFSVEIAAVRDSERDSVGTLCLPQDLPKRVGGGVNCRLRANWEASNCERVGGEALDVMSWSDGIPDPPPCLIDQVTAEEAASGAVGWYYDDSSESVLADCEAPYRHRIAFTEGFVGEADARFVLLCESAQADAVAVGSTAVEAGVTFVREDSCVVPSSLAGQERFGQSCTPEVPVPSYRSALSYVEPNNGQCPGGACLIYELEGAIAQNGECEDAECAAPEDVADRVYCSCRCDADEPGDMPLCDCPAGFICKQVLGGGPAAGSYCTNARTTN